MDIFFREITSGLGSLEFYGTSRRVQKSKHPPIDVNSCREVSPLAADSRSCDHTILSEFLRQVQAGMTLPFD
ncbi:MAG: hypothetical protein WCG29_13955, partial [Desulfomonile sp.]